MRGKNAILLIVLLFTVPLAACVSSAVLADGPDNWTDTSSQTQSEQVASAEPSLPAPTATPTPTPTPKRLPDEQELEEMFLFFPAADFVPETLYPDLPDERNYTIIQDYPEVAQALFTSYETWLHAAVEDLQTRAEESFGTVEVTANLELPAQQLLSAVGYLYRDDPQLLANAFPMLIRAEISLSHPGGGTTINIRTMPQTDPSVFYALPLAGEDGNMSGMFLYTYINTLFDENLEPLSESKLPPVMPPALELFPLEENFFFVDGWLLDRDGGARMHTGTDILAPEGSPHLACAHGTILDVGSNAGAGNYVVLRGDDGTQYHYYHMVELSTYVEVGQTVEPGDILGLTGNTGNSTANHLHFTMISADGYYINPYSYLMDAAEKTFGIDTPKVRDYY